MYSCLTSPDELYDVYAPTTQSGNGFDAYVSSYKRQKGYGIGGIFGTIARRLIPLFRDKILPFVLPFAKKMGQNVAMDVIEGRQNFSDSLKTHGVEALKDMGRSAIGQSGSGKKRKAKSPPRSSLKKLKKTAFKASTQSTPKRKLFTKRSIFD